MGLLEGDGLGFGLVGRVKRSLDRRAKNVQGTISSVRDTAIKGKAVAPGSIVSTHVQGAREANRELAPALKDL
jgi:hypothetical protein